VYAPAVPQIQFVLESSLTVAPDHCSFTDIELGNGLPT